MKKLIGFVVAMLFVMAHSGGLLAESASVDPAAAEHNDALVPGAEHSDANGHGAEDKGEAANGEEPEAEAEAEAEAEEEAEDESATPVAGSPVDHEVE